MPISNREADGLSPCPERRDSGVQAGELALSPLGLDRWIAESISKKKPEAEWRYTNGNQITFGKELSGGLLACSSHN